MRLSRRILLTAAACLFISSAFAGEAPIYRVNGSIGEGNFRGLAAFLANSVGEVFALKIKVPKSDGDLSATADGGQLVISQTGSRAEFQIIATDGFEATGDKYVFDGFYEVSLGEAKQGVTRLVVTADKVADALAADFKIQNLQAARLNPNIRN
jgi:hypothetical protein